MSDFSPSAAAPMPWAPPRVQARIAELGVHVPVDDPEAMLALLQGAVASANDLFDHSATLYAGANAPGHWAERWDADGLSSRPTLGLPGEKFPTGVDDLDVIEVAATQAVRTVMGCSHADVRPPTATLANLAVLTTLTRPGDTIAALPERAGGHVSHRQGAPSVRGLRVDTVPYDYDRFDVDTVALAAFLAHSAPKLLILGGSVMLRPHDLKSIVPIAREHGVPVLYDGSHVAGLIAGGVFQRPMEDGVDVLTFSTYKSFGGPAGGVVCTNDVRLAESLSTAIFPTLTANYDIARLGPLALAASELAYDGGRYARQCVENARAFGEYLCREGLQVLGKEFGYTQSHHLVLDVQEFGGGNTASRLLAEARIFLSPTQLPVRVPASQPNGLRIGTQELTRRGVGTGQFDDLARITAAVLRGELRPDKAADQVTELVS